MSTLAHALDALIHNDLESALAYARGDAYEADPTPTVPSPPRRKSRKSRNRANQRARQAKIAAKLIMSGWVPARDTIPIGPQLAPGGKLNPNGDSCCGGKWFHENHCVHWREATTRGGAA